MKLRNVWIVFRKEFLDIIRDRRTIFSMILLPVVVFPGLMYGVGMMMTSQMQKLEERRSVIAVQGSRWAPVLLGDLQARSDLQVISSIQDSTILLQQLLEHQILALIIIPVDFESQLASDEARPDTLQVRVLYDKSYQESEIVRDKVEAVLTQYRQREIQGQLKRRNLPPSVVEPFVIEWDNRASEIKMAGAMLGQLLPYMVILLTIVGCMYPAIDLTAGEKERGTMETLLVSPATRLELVLGKFLTTMLAGLITTALTVVSQFTGLSTMLRGTGEGMSFQLNPAAVALVFIMFIPLSAMIAALLIAIAVSARSYKEAQSYISPLMILMILPAITSMVPGLEVDWRLAFVPVVNVSLILRNAFIDIYDPTLITLTFFSTVVYAGFALFVAVRIFQKETVLLRT